MSRSYLKNFVFAGYEVTECNGDADYCLAQAALDQSQHDPTVLDATDTDILVMFLTSENVSDHLVMKLRDGRNRIADIKRNLPDNVVKYLAVAHALSGCDTTSALFRRGKIQAFKVLDNTQDMSFLDVFKRPHSTPKEIAMSGERFLLLLYKAPVTCKTLDDLRFWRYKKQVNEKKLTSASGLELRTLPPTSDAAKYHCYRAYLQVQQWLGINMDPTEWGYMRDSYLVPIIKDKPAAPDKVLRLISCGCKQGCTDKTCVCVKAGMFCTILCSSCNGRDCANIEHVHEYDDRDHSE